MFDDSTSANTTFTINSNGVTDNYTGDNPNRKPFNIYVGGGAGLQAGSMQTILGYDQSVTNISAKDNTQISRSQIKVGFGLAF